MRDLVSSASPPPEVDAGPPSLSPAHQMLTSSIAWPIDDAAIALIRARASAVDDWDEVVALAARHRVASMLHHSLRVAGIALPDPDAAGLAERVNGSAMLELIYANESVRLVRALDDAGVAVRVIKGVATALACYGRLGLRSNRDADLLIDELDVGPALAVLGSAGYDVEAGAKPDDAGWRRRHKDVVLTNRQSGLIVELHWRLFDNRQLCPDLHRSEAASIAFAGAVLPTLQPDAAFSYMCLHGAQHAWSRLKWLADLNAFIGHAEGSAASLYATAVRQGAGLAAAQALMLRQHYLGIPAPDAVQREFRSRRRLRWLVDIAIRAATRGGSAEMESLPMGATLKNVSHYLLDSGVGYWATELAYDLQDDTAPRLRASSQHRGVVGRVAKWVTEALTAAIRRSPRPRG